MRRTGGLEIAQLGWVGFGFARFMSRVGRCRGASALHLLKQFLVLVMACMIALSAGGAGGNRRHWLSCPMLHHRRGIALACSLAHPD